MGSIRTLIVDDEPVARTGLRDLLQREADFELLGECADGREAVAAIERLRPDLVFLDVQLARMNGFDVLRAARVEPRPSVILVTGYSQYALPAFEVDPIDFLLKPFSNGRFQQALARARLQIGKDRQMHRLSERLASLLDRLEAYPDAPAAPPPAARAAYLRRIPVKDRGRVTFLDVDQIDWIEAADNYVNVHSGARSFLLRMTMQDMERQLDPARFLRIHRSRIVHLDRVREVQALSSGDSLLVLTDGTRLTASRTYGEQRRRALRV